TGTTGGTTGGTSGTSGGTSGGSGTSGGTGFSNLFVVQENNLSQAIDPRVDVSSGDFFTFSYTILTDGQLAGARQFQTAAPGTWDQVPTPITNGLQVSTLDGSNTDAAINSTGDFNLISWEGFATTVSTVFGRGLDQTGSFTTTATDLAPGSPDDSTRARVVMPVGATSGNFPTVARNSTDNTTFETIKVKQFDSGLNALWETELNSVGATTPNLFTLAAPALASSRLRNVVVVVYKIDGFSYGGVVLNATTGTRFGALGNFVIGGLDGASSDPEVAMRSDGTRFAVTFVNDTNVEVRRFDVNPSAPGGAVQVGGPMTVGGGIEPDLAMDADGNFAVVYDANGAGIRFARFLADGTPFGTESNVSAPIPNAELPCIAMDDVGDVAIGFQAPSLSFGTLSVYAILSAGFTVI
ncbi:MAG: hypothetical protein KC910_21515, partial [Candidatus Eremiobacteraeota bacterium]|nr:hypothetical protein [Candidatus Eremiobacteraeota bacterium]